MGKYCCWNGSLRQSLWLSVVTTRIGFSVELGTEMGKTYVATAATAEGLEDRGKRVTNNRVGVEQGFSVTLLRCAHILRRD